MLFTRPVEQEKAKILMLDDGGINCCGISYVQEFPFDLDDYIEDMDGNEYTPTQMRKRVKEDLRILKTYPNWCSMMLVSLNEHQKKTWHRTVLNAGFKVAVDKVVNKNTSNKITLYYWRGDGLTRTGRSAKSGVRQ